MESESGETEEEAGLAVCQRGWVGGEAVCRVETPGKGSLGGGGAGGFRIRCGRWRSYTSDGNGSFYSAAGLLGRAQLDSCSCL